MRNKVSNNFKGLGIAEIRLDVRFIFYFVMLYLHLYNCAALVICGLLRTYSSFSFSDQLRKVRSHFECSYYCKIPRRCKNTPSFYTFLSFAVIITQVAHGDETMSQMSGMSDVSCEAADFSYRKKQLPIVEEDAENADESPIKRQVRQFIQFIAVQSFLCAF